MDRIHKTLMEKTLTNSRTLKMMAIMLNLVKTRIPTELFVEAIIAKEQEFRREILDKGSPIEKSFEDLLTSMKGTKFDIAKLIDDRRRELQEYYEFPSELSDDPDQEPMPAISPVVKKRKTKKIKKEGHERKKITEEEDEIFEESVDEDPNFHVD